MTFFAKEFTTKESLWQRRVGDQEACKRGLSLLYRGDTESWEEGASSSSPGVLAKAAAEAELRADIGLCIVFYSSVLTLGCWELTGPLGSDTALL